nr:MAG TPA: hypothetical protein [Caudoviricetes sp.]
MSAISRIKLRASSEISSPNLELIRAMKSSRFNCGIVSLLSF